MAWPPLPPGEIAEGFLGFRGNPTTIVWGTDAFSTQGYVPPLGINGYIVKTVRPSQRVEELRIENGSGFTAVEILLIDGKDFEVTVVDDTTQTAPLVGEVMLLITPYDTALEWFILVNNSYNAARKQEGERVLLARNFSVFSLAP